MNTPRRGRRVLVFLATLTLLTLGPVAFGSSLASAEEPAPGDVATAATGTTTPDPTPMELLEPAGQGEPTEPVGDTVPAETTDPGEESDHGEETAVLVCLATGDVDAPYSAALAMPTSIINGEGRVKPSGPANSTVGVAPATGWGNIVPPVTHPSGASFPGLNFGANGRVFWDAGCGPDDPGAEDGEHGDDSGHGGHSTVVVCVATADAVTPYTLEEWMVQAIINGHGVPKQDGPASDPVVGLFPADEWGSIIPVLTHPNNKATYPGLNWDASGQAIWEAGCQYVAPVMPPAPGPAPAPAPVDFCPDLDGMQWENYDCTTPSAAAPVAPVPTEPVPAEAVTAAMPAVVPVATAATLPAAVPAGQGQPIPVLPTWAALLITISSIGAAAAAVRRTSMKLD